DYSVMLLVSVVFALLCWRHPRQIGRGAGILLTGGFIVWLAMLRYNRHNALTDGDDRFD
ncbi:hypothetical protein MJM59_32625, partial [Salmonella enterica subsp. enterica serovar Montevideo]|nr:hypothetical protein [Salmonella enterica subsp. enterica serovar Montevideo]